MKNNSRFLRIFQLPWLPIWLGPVLLLSPILAAGKALFWGTVSTQFVPWQALAFAEVRQGIFPWWNPFNGMGAPLFANYQLAFLYPPTWIAYPFYLLGGIPWMAWSDTVILLLHLILGGFGFVYLTRKLGLPLLSQSVTGIAFAMGGFLIGRLEFFSIVYALTWLPWLILAVEALSSTRISWQERQKSLKPVLAIILVLIMVLLAGHAQTAWYMACFSGLWLFFRTWQRQGWKRALISMAGLMLIGIVAAGAVSFQLAPTLEYMLNSQRASSVDYQTVVTYSFWPWRFLTYLAPDFFGNPGSGNFWGYASYWEDAVFIGVLPFLMSVGSLLFFRQSRKRQVGQDRGLLIFLWASLVVAIILALGKNLPVFPFLYWHIPTFNLFKAPTRWMLIGSFALILLCGFGLSIWRRPQGRLLFWVRLGAAAGAAVSIGAGSAAVFLHSVQATFITATAILGVTLFLATLLWLFIPEAASPAAWKKMWPWLVAALVVGDLWLANYRIIPSINIDFYAPVSDGVITRSKLLAARTYLSLSDEYQLKYARFFRFADFRSIEAWSNIRQAGIANTNLLDLQAVANNFDPFLPARYSAWMDRLEKIPTQNRDDLYQLMNVGSVTQLDVARQSGISVINIRSLGMYQFFAHAKFVHSPEEALDAAIALYSSGKADKPLIVESDAPSIENNSLQPLNFQVQSSVEYFLPTRQIVDVDSSVDFWLFESETYYPGWKVKVDGAKSALLPADGMFRAVWLKNGKHRVEFYYQPDWLFQVAGITMAAWLVVSLLITLALWKSKPDKEN
jgi:hypothetical protein